MSLKIAPQDNTLTLTVSPNINLCMKGTIRTFDKCPRCGGKFKDGVKGLRCAPCKTTPSRYYIDFPWKGERLRLFCDRDDHPFSSYEAAHRYLTVMRAKVDEKDFDPREYIKIEVKKLYFENYAAAWLERRERQVLQNQLSRGYLRSAMIYLNRYVTPYFKGQNIRDIQEGDLEDFRDQLPLHLKPKTVYNIIGILSKIFNDARRRRDIHRLPEFPRIEVADPETCWIGKQEQRRVLDQVKDPLKRALYLLMMETGVRPGEARALKWSRVQFGADIIVIAAAMDEDVYKERTQEKDVRFLPMEPQVKHMGITQGG